MLTYRLLSVTSTKSPPGFALVSNSLGTLNRINKGKIGADLTLSDGTPPTIPVVNERVFSQFGVNGSIVYNPSAKPDDQKTYAEIDSSMTYGPAFGFPYARAAIGSMYPQLGDLGQSIVGGGEQDSFFVPFHALKASGVTTIYVHEDMFAPDIVETAELLEITIIKINSTESFNDDDWVILPPELSDPPNCHIITWISSDNVPTHLEARGFETLKSARENGLVRVMFDDKLSGEIKSEDSCSPSVGIDLYSDDTFYQRALIDTGYLGPIFHPYDQLLLHYVLSGHGRSVSTEELPSRESVTSKWMDYVKAETSVEPENAAIISGGCSGALFSASTLCKGSTHIVRPFFAPQEGISQIGGSETDIHDTLNEMSEKIKTGEISEDDQILLTFPNNPDGTIPDLDDLRALCQLASDNNIRILVDFTYFNLVGDNKSALEGAISLIQGTKSHLIVASASKALGCTKFRSALIFGDTESVGQVSKRNELLLGKVGALDLLAIDTAIDHIEEHISPIRNNVEENRQIISKMIENPDQEISVDDGEVLNSGLLTFQTILRELYAEGISLTFEPGEGALYGFLRIEAKDKDRVFDCMERHKFILVPGEIFSGYSGKGVQEIVDTPQGSYRMALMAKPRVERSGMD